MMTNKTTAGAEAGFDLDKLKPIIDEIKAAIDEVCRGADVFMASMLAAQKIDVLARRAAPATADKPVQAGEAVDNLTPQSLDLLRKGLRDWETPENRYAAQRVLDAIEARASLAPVSAQQGAAVECGKCNDTGIVGFPPDQYEACPDCNDPAAKAPAALADALELLREIVDVADAEPECVTEAMWKLIADAKAILQGGACPAIASEGGEKDAARYRWLTESPGFIRPNLNGQAVYVNWSGTREALNKAIDAAMRATQQEGGNE
jgi:hypothetical protein